MYKEIIHDIITGEVTERPYTPEEIEEAEKAKQYQMALQAKAAQMQATRDSAIAKLTKLGLTEEEIASLL